MKTSKNIKSTSKPETLMDFYKNITNVSNSEKVMFDNMIELEIDNFFKSVPLLKNYSFDNTKKAINILEDILILCFLSLAVFIGSSTITLFNQTGWSAVIIFSVLSSFVAGILFFVELKLKSKMSFIKRIGLHEKDNSIKSQYIQLFMLKMLLNNNYSNDIFNMPNPDLHKKKIFDEAIDMLKSGSNIDYLLNLYLEKNIIVKDEIAKSILKEDLENKKIIKMKELEENRLKELNKNELLQEDEILEAKNIILINMSKSK